MTLYDFLGNQLKVGDVITYVTSSNGQMKCGLLQAFVSEPNYPTFCRLKIVNRYTSYSFKAKKMVTKVRSVHISGGSDGSCLNGIMVIKNPEFYMSCPAIQNILEIIQDSSLYVVQATDDAVIDINDNDLEDL